MRSPPASGQAAVEGRSGAQERKLALTGVSALVAARGKYGKRTALVEYITRGRGSASIHTENTVGAVTTATAGAKLLMSAGGKHIRQPIGGGTRHVRRAPE